MGVGLIDSRGWNQTHSGTSVDTITLGWNHFDATYRPNAATTSVDLSVRLMAEGRNVSGTLEVRNLVLTESVAGHDAAYPILTSSASTSADGKMLYLIVLNKSASDSISGTIHLDGFSAAVGQYWQVNGPSLGANSGVGETARSAPLRLSSASMASYVFPAHSMTAMEFNGAR